MPKQCRMGILTMFGRRMRALWEAKEGEEFSEVEFVDKMLIGGIVERGQCSGCNDFRNVLNGFLCVECNKRCVRREGFVR